MKLKIKDIQKMSKDERAKKIDEMKFEMIKSKANAAKSGSLKTKEIKKTIARILTLNNQEKKSKKVEENK
jgi:ribosomal protein L29